ncbi:MAG: hypothetical protein D3923_02745 [Candidatus Electrothrix sp. AR3]|nr:hypothetical protein [Candidatus Electrothrix sp. AR3]
MHDDKFTKGMRGEFRGDFTRDTFDPMRNFSRVLMQQGRVQVDADWNEQVSILLHYMRQLGRDLMGPHGAPKGDDGEPGTGFEITADGEKSDFSITSGNYYIDGICCEIGDEQEFSYRNQPNYPITGTEKLSDGTHLVYLDVWERHLTYVEDDYMREKALGGADTATRAQIVWQVKLFSPDNDNQKKQLLKLQKVNEYNLFKEILVEQTKPSTGQLKARAKKASEDENKPCLTAPEASYRGAENQLYRVEIHNPGKEGEEKATFKWSRENGSVIFPILDIGDDTITLEHLGRDDRFGLQPGDWVEVLDDNVVLRNEANPLLKVTAIDRETFQVTLEGTLELNVGQDLTKHPYLRRWDQKKGVNAENGALLVTEKNEEENWISLEDGVEIQFEQQEVSVYQTGDYWLIPARTATGDVEWPGTVDEPDALPPQGVEHHYAPLAIIKINNSGEVSKDIIDLRRQLKQGWE